MWMSRIITKNYVFIRKLGHSCISLIFAALLAPVVMLTVTCSVQAQSTPQEQYIEAQIENQKAQATYYRMQTSPKGFWQTVISAIPSVMGTIVGAMVAFVGVLFAGWRQARLERDKWERAQSDEWDKETRLALAELTRGLAAGVHAIAWCTWKAKYEPDEMKNVDFAKYDKEIKGLFPTIVGARVVLAGLDSKTHEKMAPLIKKLYKLDKELAQASVLFRKSRQEGINRLVTCYSNSNKFDKEILQTVTEIFKDKEGVLDDAPAQLIDPDRPQPASGQS